MTAPGPSGMRTIVVGASSGLGRTIGVALAQRGDDVALLARRQDRIADAAEEAGPRARSIVCDVTDEASCRAAIDEAAAAMGGVDALVYAAGVGPLQRLADLDAATWRHTLDTNVVGAAVATAAALPHLTAARGVAVYLSSVSASQTAPWPGLGAYTVSKAALDKLVEAWRVEHPEVGFTRVVVGDCAGGEGASMTEFPSQWDSELAVEMAPVWMARGYMTGSLLPVEELVRVIDTVLRCEPGTNVPTVVVTPRPPT